MEHSLAQLPDPIPPETLEALRAEAEQIRSSVMSTVSAAWIIFLSLLMGAGLIIMSVLAARGIVAHANERLYLAEQLRSRALHDMQSAKRSAWGVHYEVTDTGYYITFDPAVNATSPSCNCIDRVRLKPKPIR